MDNEIYLPRLIDKQLTLELKTFGAVCIEERKMVRKNLDF